MELYTLNSEKLLKQTFADFLVVGIHGDQKNQEEWENLISNYKICKGRFHRVAENFSYFICNRKKLEWGLNTFLRGMMWLGGDRTAEDIETGKHRFIDLQTAHNFVKEITEERFYSHLAGDNQMADEHIVLIPSQKHLTPQLKFA